MTEVNLVSGILAALAVAILVWWTARKHPTNRNWVYLKPSALHWTAIFLGTGLGGFFIWVWMFVGSSRADAEGQMQILGWLIIAFSCGTALAGWQVWRLLRLAIRFRGTRLVFREQNGKEREIEMKDLEGMRVSLFRGYVIQLKSGDEICIDPYATGAQRLLERIGKALAQST